jgi:hypothetical protein
MTLGIRTSRHRDRSTAVPQGVPQGHSRPPRHNRGLATLGSCPAFGERKPGASVSTSPRLAPTALASSTCNPIEMAFAKLKSRPSKGRHQINRGFGRRYRRRSGRIHRPRVSKLLCRSRLRSRLIRICSLDPREGLFSQATDLATRSGARALERRRGPLSEFPSRQKWAFGKPRQSDAGTYTKM